MSNANFKINFAKLLAAAGAKAEMVVRKTALELQSQMIDRSPVDTGRFKGNWNAAAGAVDASTSAVAANDALGRSATVLQGWKPGQTIFLTNSLPYARVLEYGRANGSPGSLQAPAGVVRLTVQGYASALAKAVSEIKT